MTERRATLSSWLDRILIGAVGLIIVWFGGRLEKLTNTVQRLCETMSLAERVTACTSRASP